MSARSLFPREHGTSVELLFPLLTVWSIGRPSIASIALGVAAILVLVMHEALLVLAGRRGERRRAEQRRGAIALVATLGTVAAGLAALGIALASDTARVAVAVPAVLGSVVLALALHGRERTTSVEVLVAAALSSIAVPVGIASEIDPRRACEVAAAWWSGFTVATLAARGVLLRIKDHGARLRRAGIAAGLLLCVVAALAISRAIPLGVAVAPAPFTVAALVLVTRPPSPQRMTAVGLGLAGASVLAWIAMLAL